MARARQDTLWVLVVDDDPEVRRVVRRGLEREGCQVAEAGNGPSALRLAGELAVDVVVLDRNMPGMSGLELMAELRRRAPTVHVIMLTGASAEADRVQGLVSGADDYMVKPFSSRELAARVVGARRRHLALTSPTVGPSPADSEPSGALMPVPESDAALVLSEGRIIWASPAALELLAADSHDRLMGSDWSALLGAKSVPVVNEPCEPGATDNPSRAPQLIVLHRLDGRRQQAWATSTPIEWDGRPASQVSLWAQSESHAAAPRDRSHVHEDTEAVVVIDAESRIQTLNPAAERLYGWPEGELHGRRLDEVIGTAMSTDEIDTLHASLQKSGHWHAEVDHNRRDGSTVRVRSSGTVLRHDSGAPAGAVLVSRALGSQARREEEPTDFVAEIRSGIARHEFVVHYQPIVRLKDSCVVGVEALVRWQHPERGLRSPAAFMETAEGSGAIIDIGAFVLNEARAQWAAWHDAGHVLYMSVNLSGRQLADPNLPALLAATRLPEGQLWLEVTETSLVRDLDEAVDMLNRVTALGPKVSIDDFGTGWASMTYLREFPVHALKIDGSFVRGVGTSSVDTAIVSSVLALGRELGLKVIAEGIETVGQHAALRDLGCEFGQGFLFGRPVPPDQLRLTAP